MNEVRICCDDDLSVTLWNVINTLRHKNVNVVFLSFIYIPWHYTSRIISDGQNARAQKEY